MTHKPAQPIAQGITPPIRVTYADTDRMNHAYHANYLVWFEIGRTELLRSLGQSYKNWEEDHKVYLPVRRCSVEYLQPALYDDVLRVETQITHLTRASIHFSYRLLLESDNALLATGSTEHVFMSESGRILRAADKLLPQFFPVRD
jgi:acyl-CoA thioester hydrolase